MATRVIGNSPGPEDWGTKVASVSTESPQTTAVAALTDAPVLAHVTRGEMVESVHRASLVVTAPDGSVEQAWGGVASPVFPRSSNKPIQALAMLRAGLTVPPRHLALACASHSAQPFHLVGVREMLDAHGLSEADLQNTPDLPYDEDERTAWIAAHRTPRSLSQNCSGKHAAMLATCRLRDWDLATYRAPEHPLQQLMAATIEELAGEPVAATAVDGCGAPVMALSLQGLARAFGHIASGEPGTHEAAITDAMRTFPEYVGGTRRDVTALMAGTDGLIAKDGAESVYAVGLADGRGVALKVADGAQRARPVIMAAVLRRLGLESAAYAQLEHAPILGHGQPVGAVVAVGI